MTILQATIKTDLIHQQITENTIDLVSNCPAQDYKCRFYTSLLLDYSRLIQGCLNATSRHYQNFFKTNQESFNSNQSPPPSCKPPESFKTISNARIILRLIFEFFLSGRPFMTSATFGGGEGVSQI